MAKTSKSKRVFQIFLFLGTFISLFYVPWPIVKVWLKPIPKTIQEQLDKVEAYGFDGIIVYVDQNAEKPAFYSAGVQNRVTQEPADPQSLFKIASISKLYVAVAVAKLAHANRLDLDKTLADYFPELEGRIEYAETITLRMMVQHRSGIPNYTSNPAFWADPEEDKKEALEYALDLPTSFKPDAGYEYSNTNYLLIRKLLDELLGYDHFQFIREEILTPLNLHNTYGSLQEVNLDDVMSGYYVGIEEDLKSTENGMLATAEDVGKFVRALNDGSVFQAGEEAIYTSIYVYDHTGLVPGYQSIAKYHKDIDAVVVQFTNTTNFDGYNWNLSEIMYNRVVKLVKKTGKDQN